MKLDKLVLIVIAVSVATVAGCDEAAMVDEVIIDGLTAPTNPNREEILNTIENFPNENSTHEETQEWAKVIIGAAVNTNVLDITDCTPHPLVIEVGYGEAIEVKNQGLTEQALFHGGETLTVPAGSSRRIIPSRYDGNEEGEGEFAGYGCVGKATLVFYTNPELQKHVYFRIVQFLSPNGESGPGLEGARVTPLTGSNEGTKEIFADGLISFSGELPLTVLIEKENTATEVTVTKNEEVVVLSIEQNIDFRVVEPLFPHGVYGDWPIEGPRNGPGIEGVRVTPLIGSDEGIKETNQDGKVTFFGTVPLTVRIEKEGYVTTEAMVGEGTEVVFPNEWPEEAEEAIRQLGLSEFIASGLLILRFGSEVGKIAPEAPEGSGEARGFCRAKGGNIIVVQSHESERWMTEAVIGELAHTWISLQTYGSLNWDGGTFCGTDPKHWAESKKGQAWIVALKKDLQEIGPIPDFDNLDYGDSVLIKDLPKTNFAAFYGWRYSGYNRIREIGGVLGTKEEERARLSRLAPNRYKHMDDLFGPPPK